MVVSVLSRPNPRVTGPHSHQLAQLPYTYHFSLEDYWPRMTSSAESVAETDSVTSQTKRHFCIGYAVLGSMEMLSWVLWKCCPGFYGNAVLGSMEMLSWVLWKCCPGFYGNAVLGSIEMLSWLLWKCCPGFYGNAVLGSIEMLSWLLWKCCRKCCPGRFCAVFLTHATV